MDQTKLTLHIITQEDPFFLPVFFSAFLPELDYDRFTITGIDITRPLGSRSFKKLIDRVAHFYGPVDFVKMGMKYARLKAAGLLLPRFVWRGTVRRQAARFGIPVRDVRNVNAPAYVSDLKSRSLDLLVSVAASEIFKDDLLSVPRLDAINIHTGKLPHYRGMMPVFRQLAAGESSIGVTVHTMTPKIDKGEIVGYGEFPVGSARSLDAVIRRGKAEGARLMLEVLERYRAGTTTKREMELSQARYFSFPTPEDVKALRRKGFKLV